MKADSQIKATQSTLANASDQAMGGFIESEIPDNEYDLGTKLSLYATLTEKAVYVNERDIALAEMLVEMKLER